MGIIYLHDEEHFVAMRRAGKLAARTLDYIGPFVKPGVSTYTLDKLCHDFIVAQGAIPAPLNYHGFPKSICTSVNHVVCHGIPSVDKILEEGDIINIDVTVIVDGWHGDTCRMFHVGETSDEAKRLVDAAYEALRRGIAIVRPGATLGDVGHAIQTYVEGQGFSVVRDFCGHGIGLEFHTYPEVLHYGKPGEGLVLREGMFFTIEPMINIGGPDVSILSDGWTVVTKDLSWSAQFEHTIGVTKDGAEIFTVDETGGDPS